jgi:DNA-binding protein H-NS
MQRKFLFAAALAGALLPASPLIAQETPATIAAEREEMEANYKRMSLRVEQMEDTLQNQQKRIATLVEEIHNLREQVDKLRAKGESTATQDSIKQLAEKIEEVDKKRIADNELISKKLGNLGKELSTTLVTENQSAAAAGEDGEDSARRKRTSREKLRLPDQRRRHALTHRDRSSRTRLESHPEASDGHQPQRELEPPACRPDDLHSATGEVTGGGALWAVTSKRGLRDSTLVDPVSHANSSIGAPRSRWERQPLRRASRKGLANLSPLELRPSRQ